VVSEDFFIFEKSSVDLDFLSGSSIYCAKEKKGNKWFLQFLWSSIDISFSAHATTATFGQALFYAPAPGRLCQCYAGCLFSVIGRNKGRTISIWAFFNERETVLAIACHRE
jgi:hypothetical protein